jgi:hypothetical protein
LGAGLQVVGPGVHGSSASAALAARSTAVVRSAQAEGIEPQTDRHIRDIAEHAGPFSQNSQ